MNASHALPAVNFFMADVGGGLGPFLSTWLAQVAGWDPSQIGWVVAIGSLTGGLLSPWAGQVVDRIGTPRLLLAIACAAIMGGTLLMLPSKSFWIILVAQVIVSAGGALGSPSISGLTLAVVGKSGFPKQQGTNEAANHAGNLSAAALIAMASWVIGPMAAIVVLGVMATATLITLWLMDGKAIDPDRMRGRKKRQKGEKRGATRALVKDRRLWTILVVIALFQMGNSAMLPLIGQRLVAEGAQNPTSWTSWCVIAASATMIPVAFTVGRLADRVGRRYLLIFACGVVILRCMVAMWAKGNYWLIPIEILDGICAGTFSVALPLAIADITYGSGRTQTAMGAMTTFQAGGAALASVTWGYVAKLAGFPVAFGAMAIFPAAAIFLLFTITLKDEQPQEGAASGTPAPAENAAAISAAA
ncbi:MAG TPA: MFS transporter [Acetobacteraceae bacterium]|nr:MFS transporter [Acetobacteraceae bacterium]